MITPEYCQEMARYNAWQNNNIWKIVETMKPEEMTLDRGAFFGSIHATLTHLLWADHLWLSRFEKAPPLKVAHADRASLAPTAAVWWAERFRLDGRIKLWADGLLTLDLVGDLEWHSTLLNRSFAMPIAQTVMHFFNHQTHHRGQIHAMLTAAGHKTADTDLILMGQE